MELPMAFFFLFVHPPSFVPFCLSTTVYKAWWLQVLWEALQKVILHALLFHLDLLEGPAKWPMMLQLHRQPQCGRGASVCNLWVNPVPLPMQPGIASKARSLCRQKKTLPASHITYRLTNPHSHCSQRCQYLLAVVPKKWQIRNTVYVLRFHQMAL